MTSCEAGRGCGRGQGRTCPGKLLTGTQAIKFNISLKRTLRIRSVCSLPERDRETEREREGRQLEMATLPKPQPACCCFYHTQRQLVNVQIRFRVISTAILLYHTTPYTIPLPLYPSPLLALLHTPWQFSIEIESFVSRFVSRFTSVGSILLGCVRRLRR